MKQKFLKISALILIALSTFFTKIYAQQSWKLTGNSGIDTAINFLGTKDGKALIFKTKNVERMRIAPVGKVGIGTKTPNAILSVYSPGDYVTLTKPGYLTLGESSSSNMTLDYNVIQARNNGVASSLFLNYYGGTTYVGPSSALQVASTGTTLSYGNFNIATSAQSIQFANPSASVAPMMYMFQSGTTNTDRMVIAHSPSYPDWGLQYSDGGDIFHFIGAGTSKMSINLASGNVGIGVPSPVYKLEVCGTIRAKEVRVETGWCDYVFENNYKLRSFDELEKYINDNKHLPGIAPASEVEKDGLKVAEMNKAMMEKIEELTLYVLQLSKENKKLQSEINTLKK